MALGALGGRVALGTVDATLAVSEVLSLSEFGFKLVVDGRALN